LNSAILLPTDNPDFGIADHLLAVGFRLFRECKICDVMSNIDRRTLLYALGITSITTMLPARAAAPGKVAVAKPGENRYAFGVLPKPRHPRAKYQATIAQEHVRFLSSMHRRVPGHSCTFIIAKTNDITFSQVNSFLKQEEKNSI